MLIHKIKTELVAHIANILSVETTEIEVETPLHVLGVDSMGMVGILVFIETQYGIDLMSSDLQPADIASVSALAHTINRKQEK